MYVENLGARHKNSLILLQNIALAHKAKGEFDLVVKYLE